MSASDEKVRRWQAIPPMDVSKSARIEVVPASDYDAEVARHLVTTKALAEMWAERDALQGIVDAAVTYVRDSYRPDPRYDAERFDALHKSLFAAGIVFKREEDAMEEDRALGAAHTPASTKPTHWERRKAERRTSRQTGIAWDDGDCPRADCEIGSDWHGDTRKAERRKPTREEADSTAAKIAALRSFHGPTQECEADGGECGICAILDCPENEPLHYHHDGCPCCCNPITQPSEAKPSPARPEIPEEIDEAISEYGSALQDCQCGAARAYDAANATYLAGWTAINERMFKVEAERDALAATVGRVKAVTRHPVSNDTVTVHVVRAADLDAALAPEAATKVPHRCPKGD